MDSTVYCIEDEKLYPCSLEQIYQHEKKAVFSALSIDEWSAVAARFELRNQLVEEFEKSNVSKLESFEGFDYILLLIPDFINTIKSGDRIGIFFKNNLLLFICPNDETRYEIAAFVQNADFARPTLAKLLYAFFEKLTTDDILLLEAIEQDISSLEESLITTAKGDSVREIIALRRKLMELKRYYEQLFMITQSMEENANALIGSKDLRYFKVLTDRVDRLLHGVLNLRDYVTQVREAYQAQVDIELNAVMRHFTVITSIFLPLTLIVGWYGMNFPLPEYSWALGYPYVIVICIFVTAISLIYFKKKKWF